MISQYREFQRLFYVVVVLVVLILGAKAIRLHRVEQKSREINISETVSNRMWVSVEGVVMPDIISMGFDSNGQYGAIISSDGFVMKSKDGGNNWFEASRVPLEEGDIPNAVSVRTDGSLVVGIGIDESTYTSIYEEKDGGNWKQTKCADCGGIFANSNNTTIFVGGNGLLVDEKGSNWEFRHLPDWGQTTLYSVAKNKKDANWLVVGESNLVAIGENGKAWSVISPPTKSSLPFYSVDINGDVALVGGVNGNLWQYSLANNEWRPIKGLKNTLTVLSVLVDDKEKIATGGELSGKKGFILSSVGDNVWEYDLIPKNTNKIISVVRTANSILAATSDGHLLKRSQNNLSL